jgi:hypothetical protein
MVVSFVIEDKLLKKMNKEFHCGAGKYRNIDAVIGI